MWCVPHLLITHDHEAVLRTAQGNTLPPLIGDKAQTKLSARSSGRKYDDWRLAALGGIHIESELPCADIRYAAVQPNSPFLIVGGQPEEPVLWTAFAKESGNKFWNHYHVFYNDAVAMVS